MEPFIQLTYNEQCPLKTSQLTETSFINKRKVTGHFWLDLLERKCPEGLGEVSESLLKDDDLTPADFCYKQDVSLDIGTSQQAASYNECLTCTSSKIVDSNNFKTPLTSKYKNNNISETPCLFSQDESITHTPTSSLESQPTCHGDNLCKAAEASPSSTQVLSTPVAPSIYRSGSGWSNRRTTTPDILAEIMGQRTSTLCCLLAGGNDDDIAEWSESMATPPLKISAPAGDEFDSETEDAGETNENVTEEEDQPPSKRIARVLFSGSTANHSMEPVELSLDDAKEPLEEENAIPYTARTTETSCIAEEFLLEYYHDECRRDVNSLSQTLKEDPSPSVNRRPQSEVFSPSSPKLSLFQSPGSNTFLSPSTRTPFKALAQSTPKPAFSDNRDIVTTPRITCTNSVGFKTGLNESCVKRHDKSLARDTSVLSNSPSVLCDKAQVRAECDITRHATEVDCKLEVSDVTFGSPSRSFELAMALEADKLGSGVKKVSRTSGLGSSLSVSLNAQSSHIDQVMLNHTSSQPTEDLQQVINTPPNEANLADEDNKKTNSNSAESTTQSVDDHGNLIRRMPFCKAPGLRRSVRTKRFSYPTASQVAKQNTGKRISNDAATVGVSRVVKEDKSTAAEGKVIIDHNATVDMSDPKGGEGEMSVSKRLTSDDVRTFCESRRDVSSLSSAVNHIQKDGVLFDMDALSQFPVECICSPPSFNSLNGDNTTLTAQQQVLSSDRTEDLWKRTDITQEIDASAVSGAENTKMLSAEVHSDETTLQNRNYQEESDVIENPVSCAYLQKDASTLLSEWKMGFHTAGGKETEISDKALNCAHALLEESDLPTVSLTSHERRTQADEVVDVDSLREGADLVKGATEMALPRRTQENHDGISTTFQAKDGPAFERYSPKVDGNVKEVQEQRAAHKFVTKTDNISGLDKQQSSVVSGFCGFSTASRKQVYISESAMKQARKTLSEIDFELDVGDSGQTVKITRAKEPSYRISSKKRASGNGLRKAASEGVPYGTLQLDQLHVDSCGTNTSEIKEETEEMALQNSEQAVNELKSKQSESVNDSLLEDLLNDCKRKRRNSLATICEENEGIEEHRGEIITNTKEVSDLTLCRSDHTRSSEYQKNITTEYCSSRAPNPGTPRALLKTTSDNSVSASEAALSKAKNTWNKIDEELAQEPRHKNPESLNRLHAVPAGGGDNLPRCVSIANDSWSQIGEEMIVESSHVLNDNVLNTLEGTVNKPDQDFVPEDQYKSWTHSASSRGFKTAIGRPGENSEASIAAFSGFHTAGGKKVTLSEEALRRGKDIMKRIEADPLESLQETIDYHSANGKHHCVSKDAEDSLWTGAQKMHNIDNYLDQGKDEPGTNRTNLTSFSGFQTAAGKSVTLSKEMLEKGAAIMQQIDKSLEQNKDTSISHSLSTSGFSGFQTALGQSVKLSKESMQNKTAMMQQIDGSLQENSAEHSRSATSFSGFQTASGQSVKLSKQSVAKGAAIMQQIDRSLQESSAEHSRSAASFSGFQTASGQSVKLSKQSLEKGAVIMQQIDRSPQDNSAEHSRSATTFSGFQTASGQSVKLSKESLEKGAAIIQDIDRSLQENSALHSRSVTSFSGFQTACGQSVKLSKESLEKGAAIMQQIDRSLQDNSAEHSRSAISFSGFQTASGQSVALSKESLEKGAAIMQQIDRSLQENIALHSRSATSFSGFKTAGGQSVNLSKESLEKGAAIMQQVDRSLHDKWDNGVTASSFSGFQTASGKSVKVSKESMEKGAAIMQQIDRSLQENKDNSASATGFPKSKSDSTSFSGFSGFQTAGGKMVEISESALAKAKATMVDIDRELQATNTEAAAASLDVSGKAREQISINERETKHCGGKFEGFFSAGGQRVLVSEQALTKAKSFLEEKDSEFIDSKTKDAEASVREHGVATEVHMFTSGRSCSVEHDEALSREVLESSEALLAYESVMDASDASGHLQDGIAAGWSSLNTSGDSFIAGRGKAPARASDLEFPRRCSTPLRCSEDMFNSSHRETRDGMKPCTTTPSGVLHDRRARFHAPLRARLTTVDNFYSPRVSDGNRSLKPLRAMTPGCLKSKAASSPRTSTPLNSSANRRMSGPRPQFITPYKKQEARREVSPLARCSSSSIPVSGSAEAQGSDVVESSSKKPRISASSSKMDVKNGHHGNVSKTDGKVMPQPGFLSQLRLYNGRIKLKDYVGRGTMPGQFTTAELVKLGVSPEVIAVSSSNAGSFRFVGWKYFSESVLTSGDCVRTEDGGMLHAGIDGCVGLEEIQSAFLSTPGVDSQLVSEQWIGNHYRWLVWKLAAMEVAFPRQFAGRCLTPDWVLCQLKYRYDREIDNSNRSALKKILERDDTCSRTMVLCVSSLTVTENQDGNTAAKQTDNGEIDGQGTVNKMESCAVIEVTDGWYGIRATLDRPLTRLLHDRKIAVGQKLIVCGAELIGSEQAVSPLEAPSSLMLRLHANSTRRARWDVKLGFHSHAHAFPLPLASLFGDGGFTGCVDVIVLRQYPVQWMEKMSDGTNVFRNSRLEEREAKKFDADRQKRREKLFVKIQEEFEKECQLPEKRRSARFRRRSFSSRDMKDLHDGKEIYETLTRASDPDSVKECLDECQVRALEDYQRLLQERKCAELQSKFERVWKEQEEEQRQLQRNVVPLLKVRIADYFCKGQARQNAAFNIWRPSEEVIHLLREGSRLRIYHVAAAGVRNRQGASELQLSATRTTRYKELPSDPDVKRVVYMPRQACSFDELQCGVFQSFSEVDVVGVVVFCSPESTFSNPSIQTIYLSDEEFNLVAIKFWGGLKAVALEDLIKPRTFICCSNLTVRPDDRVQCPSLTFTELSTLTLKPRESHLRAALHKLHQSIPDMNLFMCHIQQTLSTILRPNRASPSVDVKVNTVRMYGRSSDTASNRLQNYNSALGKQCTDVTDTVDSTGRENGSSSLNGQEYRLAGSGKSTSCDELALSHKLNVSSVEEPANLVTPSSTAHTKSRQSKRKLLDSIAEPPPLSPLPSSIPASVRREFKRPRQVGSPGNVRLEK